MKTWCSYLCSNYFKSGDDRFPLSTLKWKRKWLWILIVPDCGRLFINFPLFELLGKFYCFIMNRKNAPISTLETDHSGILANNHFDDLYGAALNLPMCHRVFDELFGGGSLLWRFEVEADFLRTFFINFLTVIVCWHLCICPFRPI